MAREREGQRRGGAESGTCLPKRKIRTPPYRLRTSFAWSDSLSSSSIAAALHRVSFATLTTLKVMGPLVFEPAWFEKIHSRSPSVDSKSLAILSDVGYSHAPSHLASAFCSLVVHSPQTMVTTASTKTGTSLLVELQSCPSSW